MTRAQMLLIISRPTFYKPLGTCTSCLSNTRVHHTESFPEPAFCHECLGIGWAGEVDIIKFIELAQSYQFHMVARSLEEFTPHIINERGNHKALL